MLVGGGFSHHAGLVDVAEGVGVGVGGPFPFGMGAGCRSIISKSTSNGSAGCLFNGCEGEEAGSVASGLEGTSGDILVVQGESSKKQPLSCEIDMSLASIVAQPLERVALLRFLHISMEGPTMSAWPALAEGPAVAAWLTV